MKKNVIMNNVVLITLISAAMILCLATSPFAQEEKQTYQLESISVIATRTPKVSLDAPASISVITEDEIDAFISEDPFKPLTRAEGIWPRSYRGLADYWTRPVIRGHRALIQVDGVNWNDYGYYSHTGAIPMPDVERIDVVRGPFSALYGSMAQTAVISYTTKIPEDGEVDASASYGDWHSRYYSLRFADRPFDENDSFFYSFSFKSRTSDGYVTTPSYKSPSETPIDFAVPVTGWSKDIDPQSGKDRYEIGHQGDNWYEDYGMFLKFGYDFSPNSRLWYSFNVSEFEYGWRDGRSFLKDSDGNTLYDGAVEIQDGGSSYYYTLSPFNFTSDPKIKKSVVHTLHLNHSIPDLVDIVALFAFNDKESATHYIRGGRYKVEDNYLAQADVAATFHLLDDTFLVTIGAQGIQEDVTVEDKNLSDQYDEDSTISIREKTSGKNRILGTFIQAEYSPIDCLTAYLGGRYDHWWGSDADYSNIDGEHIEYSDVDDGKFSPKVSLVYHPLENGTIRASYGEAFTAPSLYHRTAVYYWEGGGKIGVANPNPDLKPTTNKSWEIGTEWEFWEKRIRVKATYFENDFADMSVNQKKISTLPDGTVLTEKKRVNAEDAEVNGIEAAVEAILPYNMKAGLFYAHNWSEYTKRLDVSEEGWEVEETPTDMWSLWLGYFGELIDVSLSYRYCDSRFDDEKNQYADTTYTGDDDYHVVDAKVTFRPMEHVAVSVAVDNLFDEEYYEYYRAPGRYWLGSVSIDF